MIKKIDVSVVLNMHSEALLLRPTLQSLDECAADASRAGVVVELVGVLDRADRITKTIFESTPLQGFHRIQTIEVDVGSLGAARNEGVKIATGEYIWTADGDDLVSRNCITQLLRTIKAKKNKEVLVFLEFLVAFGESTHIAKYFDSQYLTAADFVYQHPYVSRLFTHRKAFDQVRYRALGLVSGFAYEDWELNCQFLALGYEFVIAPETVLFYRQRPDSLLKRVGQYRGALVPHNQLFEFHLFLSMMQDRRVTHYDWGNLISTRKSLQNQNFADELLKSSKLVQFVVDASRLDPEINPQLLPDAVSYCPVPTNNRHWGFELESLYRMIGTNEFTDVLVLPWLQPGGAEKYILQILKELRRQVPSLKLLVVTGQKSAVHEWTSKLPEGTVFIDLYNAYPYLDEFKRISLLVRALLALSVKGARLHLKASEFAHELMDNFGAALAAHLKPIYYRFSEGAYDWGGSRVDMAWGIRHIREQFSNFYRIVSDNLNIIKKDTAILGVTAEKYRLIYATCDVVASSGLENRPPTKRILWASRICREKRPELLRKLAYALQRKNSDVKIDMFGAIEYPYEPSKFHLSNLQYCGAFSGFNLLPLHQYDAFLYTTAFDGMPNVVLEALAAGLPVLAPDIGGISEVVIQDETGLLLPDHTADEAQVDEYSAGINYVYSNWSKWRLMSNKAMDMISTRHNGKSFALSVTNTFELEPSQA